MKRDTNQLSKKNYDLIIIGGGIYGAATAWDAASRGLSVAILEKGDFGSATSSNSQKIIHGGLRYLQHADFKRTRESTRERTTMMRIAPHLIHPMPCLIPTYGRLMHVMMPIALKIFDLISFDRNQLNDPQKYIPSGKTIDKKTCLELILGLPEEGLTGGCIWYDAQVYNSERLVLSFIRSAEKSGADVANYVEVVGFLKNGNQIQGVKARDLLNREDLEIQAKIVLNASGPWVDYIISKADIFCDHRTLLSKMLLLVVRHKYMQDYAFGIPLRKEYKDKDAVVNKGYRLLFIVPWRNYSLIGTTQELNQDNPDDSSVTENDVLKFIKEINEGYPNISLTREDISFVYGGLIPIDEVSANGDVKVSKHYTLLDHSKDDIEGLVSIISVKYTTARDVAQKATDLIFNKLGKKTPECMTMKNPVHGGEIDKFDVFLKNAIKNKPHELSNDIIRQLVYNYGSEYSGILNLLKENPNWRERISNKSHVIKAQIIYAVREEMAQKLADVILRRTELGSAEYPGKEALEICATIMSEELNWDEARVQVELKEVEDIYK